MRVTRTASVPCSRELVDRHEAKGTLHRGDGPYVAPEPQPSTLRFPAKAIRLDNGNVLVADAGHHSLAELAPDGETLVRRIGTGEAGLVDGDAGTARLHEPNGLCLLPAEVAAHVGYDVVVADTVNHALRGVRLTDGHVTTVAGTGEQWMQTDGFPSMSSPIVPLSSPWDVTWSTELHEVVIAMAGIHQLWSFDPIEPSLTRAGGHHQRGPPRRSARRVMAGPARAASAAAEDRLWFVDSETSSLRSLANGVVATHVGAGLFDFGLVDGAADGAMLQHPLGVTLLPDGSVAVLDTYNGAVRRFDPVSRTVTTLAIDLREPSGALLEPDGSLLVVESAAHRLTRITLPGNALRRPSTATGPSVRHSTSPPETSRSPSCSSRPSGQKLDDRYGESTRLLISASPPELLVEAPAAVRLSSRATAARDGRTRRGPARRRVRRLVRRGR